MLNKNRNAVTAACLIAALGVPTAYSVMAGPLDDIDVGKVVQHHEREDQGGNEEHQDHQ